VQVEGEGLEAYNEREQQFERMRARRPTGFSGFEDYAVASPGERLVGYIIDHIVTLLLAFVVLRLMGYEVADISGDTAAIYLFNVSYSVINILYYLLFTASPLAATPGKWFLGLRIVDEFGDPISTGQVFLRELLGRAICENFQIFYLLILATDRHQGLHDKIASSYVVDRDHT
jgi:uncharacterized RDD family membrane protein YckC